jgi:hypothetical protein
MADSIQTWADKVLARDRRAIARAISAVETGEALGTELLKRLFPASGKAEVIADALLHGSRGSDPSSTAAPDGPPSELLGYYRELLRVPGHGRWVACPCVDVLLSEVEKAVRSGYRGIEVIKRYTSLGTGICQGRYCLPDALLLLSILENRPPQEVGYITQRPPVVVTPLAALAALPDAPASEESP